ncbi:MAG: hypothetical protein IJA34_16290 [Lachnospiraceae bacterium]|nr:hypothetical protein [Lachnospiraceae bacterium]
MSLTENNVPIQINEYFNSNYEDNLQAYLMYGNYEDDITIEDLTAGEAFYIFDNDLTNNGKIWYYPVYYNGSIFKLIAVFNYENKLYCNITEEYVEVLNEVNYNSDMLIIKEDKNTYIIDKDNNIHFIYEDESQEITVKSYEEWKKYIEDNYSFNVVLDNIVSIGNIESGVEICSGGLVEEIESDGYECCISD